MRNLDALVTALRQGTTEAVLAVIAGYPRHAETGQRDVQGEVIESIARELLAAGAADGYRVMWSQVALLFGGRDVTQVKTMVVEVLAGAGDERVEVRTIVLPLGGALDDRVPLLDAALGELSSRQNFGSARLEGAVRSG